MRDAIQVTQANFNRTLTSHVSEISRRCEGKVAFEPFLFFPRYKSSSCFLLFHCYLSLVSYNVWGIFA